MPFFSYWKEYAAFVSVLPRRAGKTHMLSDMIMEFECRKENYIIFVPNDSIRRDISSNFHIKLNKIVIATNKLLLPRITDTHVLVDEFDLIDRTALNNVLDHDWRSVTMVSTLR